MSAQKKSPRRFETALQRATRERNHARAQAVEQITRLRAQIGAVEARLEYLLREADRGTRFLVIAAEVLEVCGAPETAGQCRFEARMLDDLLKRLAAPPGSEQAATVTDGRR